MEAQRAVSQTQKISDALKVMTESGEAWATIGKRRVRLTPPNYDPEAIVGKGVLLAVRGGYKICELFYRKGAAGGPDQRWQVYPDGHWVSAKDIRAMVAEEHARA